MDAISANACTYASMLLIDDNLDVTSDKINAIFKSAGIDFVPAFLPNMFAKILSNNPKKFLMNIGNSAPAAGTENAAPLAQEAKLEDKKEEKKAESASESEEEEMGFGLFD